MDGKQKMKFVCQLWHISCQSLLELMKPSVCGCKTSFNTMQTWILFFFKPGQIIQQKRCYVGKSEFQIRHKI